MVQTWLLSVQIIQPSEGVKTPVMLEKKADQRRRGPGKHRKGRLTRHRCNKSGRGKTIKSEGDKDQREEVRKTQEEKMNS